MKFNRTVIGWVVALMTGAACYFAWYALVFNTSTPYYGALDGVGVARRGVAARLR